MDTNINVIYASENYYVVEYPAQHGYELVDKRSSRGTYFQGDVAERFMKSLREAAGGEANDASIDRIDDFLGSFDVLLNLPVVVH